MKRVSRPRHYYVVAKIFDGYLKHRIVKRVLSRQEGQEHINEILSRTQSLMDVPYEIYTASGFEKKFGRRKFLEMLEEFLFREDEK